MLTLAGKALPVPILQGGMGVGVSLGGLAGAVAACGGMGCISTADTGYREPDFAKDPVGANRRALAAEMKKGAGNDDSSESYGKQGRGAQAAGRRRR